MPPRRCTHGCTGTQQPELHTDDLKNKKLAHGTRAVRARVFVNFRKFLSMHGACATRTPGFDSLPWIRDVSRRSRIPETVRMQRDFRREDPAEEKCQLRMGGKKVELQKLVPKWRQDARMEKVEWRQTNWQTVTARVV